MEEKKKKKFYKRWWFWLIVVLVFAGIGGMSGESENGVNDGTTEVAVGATQNELKDTVKENEKQTQEKLTVEKEQERAVQTAIEQRLAEEITSSEFEKLIKDYDEELIYQQIVVYMQKTYKKETFGLSQAHELKDCIELYSVLDEKKKQEHEQSLNSCLEKCDEYLEPATFVLNNFAYVDRLDRGDYYPTELYLRRRIDSWLSDMIEGKMYYYANNYVYTDYWGDDWGDEEYVIQTEEAFSDSGYMYLWLYDTGETMTIQTDGGFERDVSIYDYFTQEQVDQLLQDYEQAEEKSSELAGELIDMIGNLGK